jgi:Flp pilus assembly protein TadD
MYEESNGNTAKAIALFKRAERLRPGDTSNIEMQLAGLYEQQKDYAAAERALQQASASNNDALYLLGMLQLEQHQTEEARQSFQRLLTLDPRSSAAHAGLAAVAGSQGQFDVALGESRRAEELDPQDPELVARVGRALAQLKRYDEAIAAYRKSIAMRDDSDTEALLAAAYDARGMKAEAEAARQQAQKLKQSEGDD